MRVDAKSMFLRLAFAFKANLILWFIGFTLAGTKLWLLAVVSFCGSQFVENSRTFSFWALGSRGIGKRGAGEQLRPTMHGSEDHQFHLHLGGRIWQTMGKRKNAFDSFV